MFGTIIVESLLYMYLKKKIEFVDIYFFSLFLYFSYKNSQKKLKMKYYENRLKNLETKSNLLEQRMNTMYQSVINLEEKIDNTHKEIRDKIHIVELNNTY